MAIAGSSGAQYLAGSSFYDEILRDDYQPVIAEAVINPNEILHLLGQNRNYTDVQGKNVVFPIHTDRNPAVGASAPGGKLPANAQRQSQKYDQYAFPTRFNSGRMLFEGILRHASKSDVASWLRIFDSEATGLAMDMARLRQRQLHFDGSGHLAKLSLDPATGTTITVELIDGIESKATCTTAATKHIKPDMLIGFVTQAAGGTLRDVGYVASITSDTVFEVTAAVDAAILVNDVVVTMNEDTFPGATLNDSGFEREPMGLAGMFSDANPEDGVTGFQGVASSGNDWNQANILDNSGVARPLTELLMQEAWDNAMEIGEANIDVMLGSFPIVRTYSDILVADKRYPSTTSLPGGYTAITFNDKPFIADRDAWNNRMYFMDLSNIENYVMADPQWIDEDGSILHRLPDNYKFQAAMFCQETFGCRVRHKNTLLTDLIEV
jgi:hypothetical protein